MDRFAFRRPAAFAIFAAIAAICAPAGTCAADSDLGREAVAVLKQHCYRCHGLENEVPGLDILDLNSLTRNRGEEPNYLVAGDLEESLLWERVGVERDMPPKSARSHPTDEQIEIIRKWIEEGLPAPQVREREYTAEIEIVQAIRKDLQQRSRADRGHQRYISLHTMANNPRFDEEDLRMARAAVSKLLNSLSRTSILVLPRAVVGEAEDPLNTLVMNIDLRDFGWSAAQWQELSARYPYGLSFNAPELQETIDDIKQLVGPLDFDGVPYLRADWLVTQASQPPMYHQLLNTPETVSELEQRLGVDSERDFLQNRLRRAAFAGSGVSRHNRLVDRHVGSQTAYYYRSYDFANSFGRSVLTRFPLGPRFDRNPFDTDFAFDHAGGEIIYSLPNGMQGYMLINQEGERIDKGPIHIVRDLRETAGTPEIVNGISCIGCHRNGPLDYQNMVDGRLTLTGEARTKVDQLFVPADQMQEILKGDRDRFLSALRQVCGPYLQQGADADKPILEFSEPVSVVVSWYRRDMTLADAASELNFETPADLAAAIRTSDDLLKLGLGPLAAEQPIPREMWDTLEESSASVFQRAAVALRVGRGIAIVAPE